MRITAADLHAAGAESADDRPGITTLTLRNGRWRLVLTEPGHQVETGTYAGTPMRTAWQTGGPGGRDEAYMSISVDAARTLRFSVVRADVLPGVP